MDSPISIAGLRYIPHYLEPAQQEHMLTAIDACPWQTALKRRVQQYGYRYDYAKRTVDISLVLGALPDWIQPVLDQLALDGLTTGIDQLIINEYQPGQGISSHIDCVPCFAETIVSISLGSTCTMVFTHHKTAEKRSLLLESGSLVRLMGEARYEWKHGIPARHTDIIAGQRVPRTRRVSLTFRQMVQGKLVR
jgi:alkylated DNA repair dioxygenase AlkB